MGNQILWVLSCVSLMVANYYWALHDWYLFKDRVTTQYVFDKYGNWHTVKFITILFFTASLLALPRLPFLQFAILFLVWLGVRWVSWELGIHLIPKEKPYEPAPVKGWWSWFYIKDVAWAVVCLFMFTLIGGYFVTRL